VEPEQGYHAFRGRRNGSLLPFRSRNSAGRRASVVVPPVMPVGHAERLTQPREGETHMYYRLHHLARSALLAPFRPNGEFVVRAVSSRVVSATLRRNMATTARTRAKNYPHGVAMSPACAIGGSTSSTRAS
jgi:hypothetical protein